MSERLAEQEPSAEAAGSGLLLQYAAASHGAGGYVVEPTAAAAATVEGVELAADAHGGGRADSLIDDVGAVLADLDAAVELAERRSAAMVAAIDAQLARARAVRERLVLQQQQRQQVAATARLTQ